jgi:hypothetical protein
MQYLNYFNIRHRNFRSSSVYLDLGSDDKIRAYIGDFDLALSDETPDCLKNIFEDGLLRWKV